RITARGTKQGGLVNGRAGGVEEGARASSSDCGPEAPWVIGSGREALPPAVTSRGGVNAIHTSKDTARSEARGSVVLHRRGEHHQFFKTGAITRSTGIPVSPAHYPGKLRVNDFF
ncbi:hypothetical protein HaLaN_07223, partial [Haematococcus lacustris]